MIKTHLPSVTVLAALLLVFCIHAFAADGEASSGTSSLHAKGASYLSTSQAKAGAEGCAGLLSTKALGSGENASPAGTVTVNGRSVSTAFIIQREGTVYLTAAPVLFALYPTAALSWQDGLLTAECDTLTFAAAVGDAYFTVNGRYCYVPLLVQEGSGALLLPVTTLAEALGCSAVIDEENGSLSLCQVKPAVFSGTYSAEDLFWLSRVIYSEAGNQPLKGRIAVGTVILNRVASDEFPNTIKEVVFAPGQFSPVSNGTIYKEPDTLSVIAAQLCLDGVKEAGDSLYFNITSMYSWADQNRTLYCTIGDHNFYL